MVGVDRERNLSSPGSSGAIRQQSEPEETKRSCEEDVPTCVEFR